MTKPIIVVKVPCKLLYVIQVKEFLIKCSTSWPYLISEFLVAYITIVASDWPRTFFTPKVFLFSIYIYMYIRICIVQIIHNLNNACVSHMWGTRVLCVSHAWHFFFLASHAYKIDDRYVSTRTHTVCTRSNTHTHTQFLHTR